MDFAMAMNYIEEKNKLGSVPGLSFVTELLERLGNPQDKCRCLHIAGTNGKGSIFSFVQETLLEAGYKVGRYISPTVFSYLERFQINKMNMSEECFAEILTRVSEKVEDMVNEGIGSPTAFEIETAIAFLYFSEQEVDYALIECGMGGRLDATNVIKNPVASVIAQISMDHMQFLGDSLEKIATEKSGIVKEHCPCVLAPQDMMVYNVFDSVCKAVNSELISFDMKDVDIIEMDISGTIFGYRDEQYKINMLGEHQVVNAVTAIETLRFLPGIDNQVIKAGLEKTAWPGRLTKVRENPYIFVDGAHNEAAWDALKKAVNKYFTNRRIIYIIGVLRDKEYHKMVDILRDTMSYVIAITPDSPRALDKEELAQVLSNNNIPVTTAEDSGEALNKAMDEALSIGFDNTVILVCGSLSFISEYLV